MFELMNMAVQKGAAVMTASVIGVLGTLFQFQYEAPVMNPAPINVFQAQSPITAAAVASTTASTTAAAAASTPTDKNASSSSKQGIGDVGFIKFSLPEVKLKTAKTQAPATAPKKVSKVETPQPKPVLVASPAVNIVTPQDAVNATSFTLNQRIDGQYVLSFHMNTESGLGLDWGLYDETIGGTSSVPKMNVSYSCDPQWNAPPSNSSDQNPTFGLNTSYACDMTMTDSIMRTATKKIAFKTGMGRLFVKSSNLSTLLKSGSNSNGLVFDNQSDTKLTVSGMTFDIYYKALNVSSPIVVRFINPDNESAYVDFPVQDLPADPAKPDTRSASGTKTSFSFSMNPRTQRLLRVELLGIQQLMTIGINPEFKVTLKEISTDNPGLKTVFFSPAISWSCIPFDSTKSIDGMPTEQNCR